MRTPSLFIGVFALTLILLLLACRGSDEPTDGPSSERSTAPADLTRATDDSDTPASPAPTPSTPGSGAAPTATGYAETDREALVALYNATNGENWDDSANWLSEAPLSEWHGVTTNADGRVTRLDLADNQLSGEIPAELGSLINLQDLWLGENQLSGEIPPELGNLARLNVLLLTDNQLSGEIPPDLGNLTNLEWLFLGNNPVERGDTAGVGQPRQPGIAGPHEEPVEWGDTAGSWPTSPA